MGNSEARLRHNETRQKLVDLHQKLTNLYDEPSQDTMSELYENINALKAYIYEACKTENDNNNVKLLRSILKTLREDSFDYIRCYSGSLDQDFRADVKKLIEIVDAQLPDCK